jgi:octaprenyl-diphosphate synthase
MAGLGRDLSLGEVDQIDSARQRDLTEADYLRIIDKKTASLFTCCVEMGAIAGGAPDGRVEALKQWSRKLGLCFQIKDDTFDYYNDPIIGKPTGNDLREGKVTLPLIYALRRDDMPERDEMLALVRKESPDCEDIERLIDFAKRAGGIDYAYDTMVRLRDEATTILAPYQPDETVDQFREIFDYVIERRL